MKGTKGKAPAFQFYPADWLSDEKLMGAELSSQAIWIKLLCMMWKDDQNHEIKKRPKHLMNALGCSEAELEQFVDDAYDLGFCDINAEFFEGSTGYELRDMISIHIVSRRFLKDNEQRRKWRERKQKQINSGSSGDGLTDNSREIPTELPDTSHDIPPLSSTSTSTSRKKERGTSVPPKKAERFKPPSGSELKSDHPWLDAPTWDLWVQFRKELGKPIKTQVGVSQMVNFLAKHQNQHVDIIKQSMANEWQGLFELKPNGNHSKSKADQRSERNAQACMEVLQKHGCLEET